MDLINEPWIDTLGGERVSIRQALLNAHTLFPAYGASIMETFSIHRFLAAFVLDLYEGDYEGESEPDILLRRGTFDPKRIEPYLQAQEISLTGSTPFMQIAGLVGEAKSIGYLTPDVPTGSNAVFFSHNAVDAKKKYCPTCVARSLISLSAWQTIGGKGLSASLNGAPPTYVLPRSPTLFQTLVGCLLPVTEPLGEPSWRTIPLPGEYQETTLLRGLTWCPRATLVDWQRGSTTCTRCGEPCTTWAAEMIHKSGEIYRGDAWVDPYAFYRRDRTSGKRYAVKLAAEHNDFAYSLGRLSEKTEKPLLVQHWTSYQNWWVFSAVTDKNAWRDAWMSPWVPEVA